MSTIEGFAYLLLAIGAYWAPAITATCRKVPNLGRVIVVNAFLGWTGVGWIVALAMACRSKTVPVAIRQAP